MPLNPWFDGDNDNFSWSGFFKETVDPQTDCFECKLFSCTVFSLSGFYLWQHRNNFGKVNGYIQGTFACALVSVAFLRALGMPPFTDKRMWRAMEENKKNKAE